jgi:hypothetical protein
MLGEPLTDSTRRCQPSICPADMLLRTASYFLQRDGVHSAVRRRSRYYPRRDRAVSYFSTSACSGNRAVLLLAALLLDFDAAAGAGSFTPLS